MDKRIVSSRILPELTSDHKLILLQLDEEENLGPIRFHFGPLWIEQEGFMEVVDKDWSIMVTESPSFVWEQKIKETTAALKEWVKTPPNTFTTHRKETVQQLADLQWEMEDKDITTHELEKEQIAQIPSFSSFRKEEEFWRLKSLSLWLKADGTVAKGFAQVKETAETHFQRLYTEDGTGDEAISNDFLSQIPSLVNEENNSNLMKPFTKEEISNVIWDMEPNKASNLKGFSAHFYRSCWTIIKFDLLRMAKDFQKMAKVGGSTKSTFLALIPKEVNPATFDRFRPISLCNVSYKILAKFPTNRIKPLLGKLISPNQGGFVAGRHTLDNVILVQESMHSSHQRKEQGMLIKLDMTNTFDRVKLSFLYKVILSFGFSPAFVNLIKACIDKPWITPLVNG
eukprot:PITA_10428